MKKKILSVLMAGALCSTLLAGCGGTKEAPTANSPAADNAATAADDNTLTVWCWDPTFNINAMHEAEKIYQKDHPDFKLNVVETPWDDVQTKLSTAGASGDLSTLPDIFLMQDNAFWKNQISFPDAFADLSATKAFDFTQFAPSKLAYSTVDNVNYGVPFDNGTVIAAYRTDILEQAGYTIDDLTDIDWSKFIEIGKDVLAKTGKPLLACQTGSADLPMIMLQSTGSSLFDDKGDPNIVGNESLKKVLQTYKELNESGVMIFVNDWDHYISTMNTDVVAGVINGCWIMASMQAASDQSGKWAITNLPKMAGVGEQSNYSNNGGSSWAVAGNSKKKDLAADFLAKTFAGSTELYDNILPSGALATWLPAGGTSAYSEKVEFFGGQEVYSLLTDFASKTPTNNTGVYYYEARDAVSIAATNIATGADVDSELKTAEDTVNFAMGK
ncbi:extracellular solute-binding protein [Lachnoanaerobaculum sp. Marseille-Q4761]|uniref:ABC transporter substrate-binding protein n=1 Tax=Lachnoanaerobaculum sp. Marseille-Q4761 TaxID=2819511 RepID=UPI001AA11EBE|nr:extracellular solute-binding protein [Lachnoanaerobaculum sp. Marseille-Q4761]